MVTIVKPKVYLVGESQIVGQGAPDYLIDIGAEDWIDDKLDTESTNHVSDNEFLTEFYSRLCYQSFGVGINPNITRVREGNKEHLENIIKVGHGSVMEHATTHWVLHNVSRVLTHELVRHRVGTAFSQESMRFVRLDDLKIWIPPWIESDEMSRILYINQTKSAEETYRKLLLRRAGLDLEQTEETEKLILDSPGFDSALLQWWNERIPFSKKKIWTSELRRIAPMGVATTIGFTCNIRQLRHIIRLRTEPNAEVEIRIVFDMIAKVALDKWPNLMQDTHPLIVLDDFSFPPDYDPEEIPRGYIVESI